MMAVKVSRFRKLGVLIVVSMLLLSTFMVFQFTPTAKAADTNLAPIFQGGTGRYDGCEWGDYAIKGDGGIYYGSYVPEQQLAFRDDTVTHNGHSSIRIEGPRTSYNWAREINNKWIAISPGDNITLSVYIKTNPQAFGYGGAIGVDITTASYRLWEAHKMDTEEEVWTYPTDWGPEDVGVNTVAYGNDWTFYQFNFTIPATFDRFDNGTVIDPPVAPVGMLPWIGASHSNDYDSATVWFADAVLIINPTDWSGDTGGDSGEGAETTDTIGGTDSQIYPSDQRLHASAITASASGVLQHIGVNVQGTTGNLRVGIYSTYSGGQLSGLLGESVSTAVAVGWNNITIPGDVEITASETYYLALVGTGGLGIYVATGGTHYYTTSVVTYGALPDPSGALGSDSYTLNMRMTYVESAVYCYATESITGSGSLTFSPSAVTSTGVSNGTYVSVYASAGDGYDFSYCNISNTDTEAYISTTYSSSFSTQMLFNKTFTAVFVAESAGETPDTSYIVLTPTSSTVAAGANTTFSVKSYDQYGSLVGDVTSSTSFTISAGAGGSWDNYIYTSATTGYWVVTATYGSLNAYANLFVIPAVSSNSTLQLPFDNEATDTCIDWSGHGNHGTISGASRSYDGYYGMGLDFDGDDYVTVIDDATLDSDDYLMISLWVKATSFTSSTILDKPDAYGVTLNTNGTVSFRINSNYYLSFEAMTLNVWQNIICRYEAGSNHVWIYISGTESIYHGGPSVNITASAHDIIIGDAFVGYLDEIYLYESTPADPFVYPISAVAYYPYCYSFAASSTSNWLTTGLAYNFTGVYIRQNSTSYLTDASYSFTDGADTMGLSWASSTGTVAAGVFTQSTGGGKILYRAQTVTLTNNALTLHSQLEIQSTIRSALSVDILMNCTDYNNAENMRVVPDLINIYGIGGSVTTIATGDGAQIAGGSIFDVMAQNSSLTGSGSSAKVSTVIPNFQHFHTLVTLYQGALWVDAVDVWDAPTYSHETGYLSYGVNYIDPSTNVTADGWYVKIEVVNGAAGDYNESKNADAWVELQCSWYNNGQYVKSDSIFCAYDAYRENDTTTQFEIFVDLWLSSQSSDSMVGGHVSAQYYGLTENGWWLWENWGPVYGLQSSSSFYDYLYDADGNVTTASALSIFNVWTEVAKTGAGDGATSDDYHVWATTCQNLQFISLPSGAFLTGIEAPVFNPTTTPDMPVGFFAELSNMFTNAIKSLQFYISTMVSSAAGVTASALNSVFSAVGVSDAVTSISSFSSSIGAYFASSVTYITDLLYTFFTLFTSIASFLIEWFGNFVGMIISIGNTVVTILNGTNSITGALGEVWSFFPTEPTFWTLFIPLILVVYWFDSIDKRAKQYGGGWMGTFMGDIQNIISVFSFIIDLSWRVVSTVIDLSMRFFNILV